jgi:hypothetical protein
MPTNAPSTATVRAWALAEGLSVAERGRLKPEVLEAYVAAKGTAGKTPAKAAKVKSPARGATKGPARTASTNPTAARTARPAAQSTVTAEGVPAASSSAAEVARRVGEPRLSELQDAVAALTARVATLEARGAAPASRKKFGRKA